LIKSAVLIILLLLPLSACLWGCGASSDASPTDILLAMLASIDGGHPAGDIYVLPEARSGTDTQEIQDMPRIRTATPELLQAAFGTSVDSKQNGAIPEFSSDILTGGALFFSTTAQPFECMVFHCISRSDTDAIAELLLCRMEALRQQYEGSDEQAAVENAQVVIVGKYVLFVMGKEADGMIDTAYQTIFK
jgi:hypothetical protein